jgi:hypothetical protein
VQQVGPRNSLQSKPQSSSNSPELTALSSDDHTREPALSAEYLPEQKLVSSETSSEFSSASPESSTGSRPVSVRTPVKKPVSALQRETSRANSKKSTGPTSLAGKNRVRWNSLKHGLLVKTLFLVVIDGEERATFFRFLKALRRDLQPVGMLEEMHVEGAAVGYWLIQRSLRCENGEIKRSQLKRKSPKGEDFGGSLINAELAEIDDHLSIPEGQALDRILRYRTAAHKDLSYHLAELERLQRARKGDQVPPPINVQVQ